MWSPNLITADHLSVLTQQFCRPFGSIHTRISCKVSQIQNWKCSYQQLFDPLYRFTYIENDEKLIVMKPSSTHELFLSSLNHVITSFINSIGQDKVIYNFTNHMNKLLFCVKPNGSLGTAIPDFQLIIENNSGCTPEDPVIPKWVRQVAFTVSPSDTHVQLKQIIES
ncbi:hypothetical protein JVT61DRAFT_12480 [Boletus reticuloceps]|uniref:Uncharacterized protein n=1 Tax=Boletus reticuloceps TaxID=495285 RepID=A0A8I2YDS5_9AGAM|nr:hypothetical protein JVT61DRAFT_12480 [Boletus reticuloceps]